MLVCRVPPAGTQSPLDHVPSPLMLQYLADHEASICPLYQGSPGVRQRGVENTPEGPTAVRSIVEGRREGKGRLSGFPGRVLRRGFHGRAHRRRLGHEQVRKMNMSCVMLLLKCMGLDDEDRPSLFPGKFTYSRPCEESVAAMYRQG